MPTHGYGLTIDAFSASPTVTPRAGAAACMSAAWRSPKKGKQCEPEESGYLNSHGTSHETTTRSRRWHHARLRLASVRVPISPRRSFLVHLIAARGALNCDHSSEAIRPHGFCRRRSLRTPDPTCDLIPIPNAARKSNPARAEHTSACGGQNASLVDELSVEGYLLSFGAAEGQRSPAVGGGPAHVAAGGKKLP